MPSDHLCDQQLPLAEPLRSPRRMIRLTEFYRGRAAKSTVQNWRKSGLLKTYRVGGLVYVDVTFDEFVRLVDAQNGGTP